ncbi:hypothetical protein SAMN05216179_0368 [Gracilibacillus kekensis]|uniref:Uncharacterized protein n=1 Tax=Gracilibacillus kekensis TaxID=1027249 RepID=A0A1M7JHN7_9BACI|nr:hypothetical protein SAMN05216179_0368 [Gracilibacillus kekensis]
MVIEAFSSPNVLGVWTFLIIGGIAIQEYYFANK